MSQRRPLHRVAESSTTVIIPSSPPPLSRSRRASLTFSPSALERFRLPDAPLPSTSNATAASIPQPYRRRSTRLQKQQHQQQNKKKAAITDPSSSPHRKKPRITRNRDRKLPLSAAIEPTNCTICMSAILPRELAKVDGCTHVFCFDCIQEWSDQENSCPNCKVQFQTITNVADKTSITVTPRNQHSDILETMLGQLASAHYSWSTAAAASLGVPDTLHSLRLALTIQARTAAMRVIHTQQHSVRLQSWLARHQNGRSYANPIEIHDDGTDVQLVE